jgi:hypothetical protein
MDKHHILPRYLGGSDTMENIVTVTRTQHVMWHFANWNLWGNTEDFIAYRGLAGTISGHEVAQELRAMNGRRSAENKTGIFSRSEEERHAHSSKGGVKGGSQMRNYIWITDGNKNTRIFKDLPLPEGWEKGVTRKRKVTPKIKTHESVRDWNEVQRGRGIELLKERLEIMKTVDKTQKGWRAVLAEKWGVCPAKVRNIISRMRREGLEPPTVP